MPRFLSRLPIDGYLLALIGMVILAALFPASGQAAVVMDGVVKAAIALLFFLYGARMSPAAIGAGLLHWRLQGTVFLSTFLLFPLLGLGLVFLMRGSLQPDLLTGMLYLCLLPSTVQSSIAFTSIAGGNVAGALTSASLSNLLGVIVTPLLVALLIGGANGGIHLQSILDIGLQILAPFAVGQLCRPLLKDWLTRHAKLTGLVDMDFYRRLEARCGVNTQHDILEIMTLRDSLYKEESGTDVRFASPPAFKAADSNADRLNLSRREHHFAGNAPRVPRSAGAQQFRLNPKSGYAIEAQKYHEPVTAGPSGTALNFVLVARIFWPAIKQRLNYANAPLSGPYAAAPSFARLFSLTMMGYLHGSQDTEHHHSMFEVLDGMQRADRIVAQCEAEDGRGGTGFGFTRLNVGDLMQGFVTGLHRLDLNG